MTKTYQTRSLLLAAVLALLLLLARTGRAADAAAGAIAATVRIDYAQSLAELQERDIRLEVLQGSASLGSVQLTRPGTYALSGSQALVSARNADGGDLGGGSWPGYLDVELSGLPLGSYTLRFSGRGYVSFDQAVTLSDCSWHLVLGTGDGTLTLGDVNGDGRVDTRDRDALSAALGSRTARDVELYDLSGDGAVDIVDLAYINRQLGASGGAQAIRTALLAPPISAAAVGEALKGTSTTVTGGTLEDLFLDNQRAVHLSAPGGESVVLPLPLDREVELSEIQIVTPAGAGAILAGEALIEDAEGRQTVIPFDYTLPQNVHAITRTPGSTVITISLGRRVPVKMVTITVTKTQGGGYAAVERVLFLQDIVPENPAAPNTTVTDLRSEALSESVRLRWSDLPNVSGYKILYWPQGRESLTRELRVDVNSALVTGLENLKPYCFTVAAIDGDWEGKPSQPAAATPQPSKAPDRVDMVSVTSLDGALSVSWKAAKGAVWYELFYRQKGAAGWSQAGGQLAQTRASIENLVNGTVYELYVVPGNSIGRGPQSATAEGTPKAADYSRPAGLPTEGVVDYRAIESIRLADAGSYSHTAHPGGFQSSAMADGDFKTHWTSQSWNDGNHERSKQVICTFKTPQDLSAALWVPRLDGSYAANLKAYTVTVWQEGEELTGAGTMVVPNQNWSDGGLRTWETIPNSVVDDRFAYLPFEPVRGVKQIAITIDQVNYTAVSLSELLFMTYSPERDLPGDIAALFTGALRTGLKSTVTAGQLDALQARLDSDEKNCYLYADALRDELALARELLAGRASSGVVVEGIHSRDSGADSRYSQGGSVLQPLGAAAQAGTRVIVYAENIPADKPVSLVATQFNAEASSWQKTVGTLQNGRNILTIPQLTDRAGMGKGGSLYVTYGGSEENARQIRLHVRAAAAIPTLELAGWYGMDEAARRAAAGRYVDALDAYLSGVSMGSPQTDWRNVTEISTPTVLLSLPAAAVRSALGAGSREEKITTLCNSVLAWEDVFHICKTTQGIDNTYDKNDMRTRQNIRCMTMFSGAFMYAAGSHIGIGYGSCGGMVTGRPVSQTGVGQANGLFGWGIAHEIGHNMDKLGRAEITNNIYSLMVQTYDGAANTLPSRLEKSGKYAAIFNKTAQGYPGAAGDVFVQLGMYWQLHLAYDDSQHGPMWFYNQFFKDWKAGTYTKDMGTLSYDDRVALTAAGVVKKDLTDFFTRWGMRLSGQAAEKLRSYGSGSEDRAVWYLSDASRRDMLDASVGRAKGTVTAQAEKAGDKQVTLTFSASLAAENRGRLQGFEIRRNGSPVAFVPADPDRAELTYTDVIGSGNHRVYRYEVAAYDTLGYEIGAAEAGTVRIAYDRVVDADKYRSGGGENGVTLTFEETTSVSGLKLAKGAWTEGGAFTITVTGSDGETHTARSGSFTAEANQAADDPESFLVYFQKPGAEDGDSRIWTYDARTVHITGVTDPALVQPIGYPGDDIALLEEGGVGRLAQDYDYTVWENNREVEKTLAKDTLVIAGTYRGNPAFNTVRIQGRFLQTSISESGEQTEAEPVERQVDGYALLFAEVPEDGAVSDISDGFFLFVPDTARESELQGKGDAEQNCDAAYLLPSQIQAVLSRTDDAAGGSGHISAETVWIDSPGGAELPLLVLEN